MRVIAVAGSINMDVINRVQRHPQPGETLKGLGTSYSPGGKGANQAVAAARAGGDVVMLGAVGGDAFGSELKAALTGYGVRTDFVAVKPGTSGLAFITVDDAGENCILLSEGANAILSADDLADYAFLDGAAAVLLQNEVPWEVNEAVIREARRRGVRVYFNPAPAMEVPRHLLASIDVLVVNETEAAIVSGLPPEQPVEAARKLTADGVGAVIVTLGKQGAVMVASGAEPIAVPSFPVTAVDTTAAGDTFIGAFACASESGRPAADSLRFAAAAAALTVTRKGAQSSIPDREEILAYLDRNPQ